jgi:DNA adenine methylase
VSYPGGKGASGVVQTIINQQPPHETYIEAFLGGGAVMLAKRPARVNIGIDLDASTIASFKGAGSSVELLCCDAKRYLDDRWGRKEFNGTELVYCDPPYLMSTRRNWSKMYRCEMDDLGHARLLQVIRGLPCMVQISGYESPMYSAHLAGWRVVKYQAATRHGVRTECLWMNYPEPNVLHDYRFLGKDYRQRERIKRKAMRWVSRLNSLPRLERLAIYGEMASSIATFAGVAGGFRPDRTDNVGSDDKRPTPPFATVGSSGDRTSSETEVLQ